MPILLTDLPKTMTTLIERAAEQHRRVQVWDYLRESSEDSAKDDRFGLPYQRDLCSAPFAPWQDQCDFTEVVDSGPDADSYVFQRPGLNRLRKAVHDGRVDIIAIGYHARIGRGAAIQNYFFTDFEMIGGVPVVIGDPDEQYDNTVAGIIQRDLKGESNKDYRETMRKLTQAARRKRAESGKPIAGRRVVYGYRWADAEKTRWVKNDETFPTLLRLYTSLVLDGLSINELARTLTTEKVPLPSGKVGIWHPSNIRAVMRNPAYIGQYDAYHQQVVPGQTRILPDGTPRHTRRTVERAPDDPMRVRLPKESVPPLIESDLWYAAQIILDRNRETGSTRNNSDPDATMLRNGLALCGECGRTMRAKRDVTKRTRHLPADQHEYAWSYTCFALTDKDREPGARRPFVRIAADALDDAVWRRFTRALMEPERLIAQYEAWREGRETAAGRTEADVQQVAKRLRKVNEDIERLTGRIAEEEDREIAAALRTRLRLLLDERNDQEAMHKAVQDHYRRQTAQAAQLYGFREYAEAVRALLEWPDLPKSERRNILLGFDARVVVWQHDHRPRWMLLLGWRNALIEAAATGSPVQFFLYSPPGEALPPGGMGQVMADLVPATTVALERVLRGIPLAPSLMPASAPAPASVALPTAGPDAPDSPDAPDAGPDEGEDDGDGGGGDGGDDGSGGGGLVGPGGAAIENNATCCTGPRRRSSSTSRRRWTRATTPASTRCWHVMSSACAGTSGATASRLTPLRLPATCGAGIWRATCIERENAREEYRG